MTHLSIPVHLEHVFVVGDTGRFEDLGETTDAVDGDISKDVKEKEFYEDDCEFWLFWVEPM